MKQHINMLRSVVASGKVSAILSPMHVFILFSLVLLTACSHVQVSLKDHYKKQAERLLMTIKDGPGEKVQRESLDLVESGKKLMRSLAQKRPYCRSYFAIIEQRSSHMMTLSLEDIEKGYHQGAALPETEDECFEVKELIVHPVTVFILGKRKSMSPETREQMTGEIDEVLAHLDVL